MVAVGDILLGIVIALLITAPITIGIPALRYWLWKRKFLREWRVEREQWFEEHRQCCELDESYLNQPYG